MNKKGILELLSQRPVVGDGSMIFLLERRGYVSSETWTPEVVIEHPDAVRELQHEYLRAGADVLQTCTFASSESRLQNIHPARNYTSEEINKAACDIAIEMAATNQALVCGSVSPAKVSDSGREPISQYRELAEIFLSRKVDFVLAEFFIDIVDIEAAMVPLKDTELPLACTMRIGPTGDINGVTPAECAVRMAKAGADIIGLNCQYDPSTSIKTIKLMKDGLQLAGLSPFLMVQPAAFLCPEAENSKFGFYDLPECPYALEPRHITRWEARRFAREAREAGVHYIGGCCGFEPYHIREIAEELADERGFRPPGKDKYEPYANNLRTSVIYGMERHGREFWMNLVAATGRPGNPVLSVPLSLSKGN